MATHRNDRHIDDDRARSKHSTSAPDETWRQAKHPKVRLAGGYGSPVHSTLVPVPIGCWLASLVFDVASWIGGPVQALYVGSYWLIAIGVVVAVAAAVFGFLDLLQVPAGTHVQRIGLVHMGLNLTATTLYLGSFLLRWAWPPPVSGGVPVGLVALSGAAFALLAVSGHLGGRLAYRYGVRVADELAQREGYDTDTNEDR